MTKTHLEAPTTTAERQRAAKSMAARLSNKLVIGGKLVDAITRETFPGYQPASGAPS